MAGVDLFGLVKILLTLLASFAGLEHSKLYVHSDNIDGNQHALASLHWYTTLSLDLDDHDPFVNPRRIDKTLLELDECLV